MSDHMDFPMILSCPLQSLYRQYEEMMVETPIVVRSAYPHIVIIRFPSAVVSYPRLIAAMKLTKHMTAQAMVNNVRQMIFFIILFLSTGMVLPRQFFGRVVTQVGNF